MKRYALLLSVALLLASSPGAIRAQEGKAPTPCPTSILVVTADIELTAEQACGGFVEVTQPGVTLTLPAVGATYSLTLIKSGSGGVTVQVANGGLINGQTEFLLSNNLARRLVSGIGSSCGVTGASCWYSH